MRASKMISAIVLAMILATGFMLETKLNEYRAEVQDKQDISEVAKSDGKEINFSALKGINPDLLGWIYLEDTQIDYPVVQGETNEEYLHKGFDGTYSFPGSIFVDADCRTPFEGFNTIVYGHHMSSGAMFAGLEKYKDREFFDAHPDITFIREDGHYRIRVAAFLNEREDSEIYSHANSTEDRKKFLSLVESRSINRSDVDLKDSDTLVTLSTCAYEFKNARYIVVGKLEREEKKGSIMPDAESYSNIWLYAQIGVGIVMLALTADLLKSLFRKKRK